MQWSRRWVMRSLCGCAVGLSSNAALARVLALDIEPQVSPDYQPGDADERGLWQVCENFEKDLAASNLLVKDAALKTYLDTMMQRMLGSALAADLRIYVVRDPEFNASMFPNGLMVVNTGLMARMQNEAQLAAVLGHESGHYLRRHTLQNWRSLKTKTALMGVFAFSGIGALAALAINGALASSQFSFSRTLESEADAFGLKLMGNAKYDLDAASAVWSQVIEERKASAAARDKKYRDQARSAFSTHPPTDSRMTDLAESAAVLRTRAMGERYPDGRNEWRTAIAGLRQSLLDEQIKLNDSGASLYLLNALAREGWDGMLRYFEGEAYRLRDQEGDAKRAEQAYAAAVELPEVPAEGFRAHGYAQLKAGNADAGRGALLRYLELQPGAADAAMVRFTLQQ